MEYRLAYFIEQQFYFIDCYLTWLCLHERFIVSLMLVVLFFYKFTVACLPRIITSEFVVFVDTKEGTKLVLAISLWPFFVCKWTEQLDPSSLMNANLEKMYIMRNKCRAQTMWGICWFLLLTFLATFYKKMPQFHVIIFFMECINAIKRNSGNKIWFRLIPNT